jgi:2-dehydropantoate 2-reductase
MAKHALPSFRIAVVGAGAIGSYYGGKLANFGRDVHFLMRSDLREVRRSGLRIAAGLATSTWRKVNCYASTEEIGACDLVLIAVKTTGNTDLLALIPPLLHETTMLLTLQNGLGNEEFLSEHFGAERVLGGLCFVGLNRTAPGVIEHYDGGRVILAEYGGYPKPRTHDIAWEFKRCGVVSTGRREPGVRTLAQARLEYSIQRARRYRRGSTRPRYSRTSNCAPRRWR